MGSGRTMTWKASESTSGAMGGGMRASTITTRNGDSGSITGPMAESTRAGGARANSMVLESIKTPRRVK